MAGANAELRRQEAVKLRQEQIRKAQKKAQVEGLKNMGKDAVMQEAVKAAGKQIGSMFSGAGAGAAQGSGASGLASYGSYLGPQSGAGAASGGLGSLASFAGPAATAALAAYVLSNMLDRQPKTKLAEEKRFTKLADRGVTVDPTKYQRRFREDLAPDFVGKDKDGNFVNNKFFTSRDVKDLTADDLLSRPALYEMFGNADEAKMRKFADAAIKQGLVDESYGAININRDAKTAGLADAFGLELKGSGQRRAIPLDQRLSLMGDFLKGGNREKFNSPYDYGEEAWRNSREARMFGIGKSGSEGGPSAGADVARLNYLRQFDADRAKAKEDFISMFAPSETPKSPEAKPSQPAEPQSIPKPGFLGMLPGNPELAIDWKNIPKQEIVDTSMQLKPEDADRLKQLMGDQKNWQLYKG